MTADRDVLVLDADTSYPIDILASLSRKGLRVHAADTGDDFPFSKYSRHTASYSIVAVPGEFVDSQGFFGDTYFDTVDVDTYRAQLVDAIEAHDVDVLLPYREEHVIVLSAIGDDLCAETGVKIALPDHEDVLDGVHKRRTMRRAEAAGLSMPRSYYPDTESEVREVVEEEGTPLVAKPSFGRGARGVEICESEAEAVAAFEEIRRYSDPLLQEFVEGKKYVACTVADRESTPLASFVAQVHHMSDPDGGGSICSRTTRQETVRDELLGMVDAFDWVGPATPEYIVDSETGEAKLMEINPRMFGHTSIAIRSGVDVPYLFYRVALDEAVEPDHTYEDDLLWMNVYAMVTTGQIREWSAQELLSRLLRGKVCQSDYPISDPVYAALNLGWDLKSDLL
jgi:predicted ATP-grasp superfamily ATP-dependent carboligase